MPLYESAFHALMLLVLWRLGKVEALRWQLLKLYLIAYCAFRFLIEFIRVEPRVAFNLTGYQFGAAALAALMSLFWWQDEQRKKKLAAQPAQE